MSNQERDKNQEIEPIDVISILNDYFRIFRRMWAWILILAIVGTGVFYVRARMQYTPFYTATATFTVNIQQDQQSSTDGSSLAFFDNSAAEQMATTFPYILTSGVLRRKVAKDMGIAVTSSISASVTENTNLFTISVTDQDAEKAYQTLQSVIKNYPEVSEVIVGKTRMEMLDESGVPTVPDNPKAFGKKALTGTIVGVMIGMLWCMLLVITRRTIRTEKDIRKWMNTKCLGTVPQIMMKRRAKSVHEQNIVLTDPKVEEALQEPLRIVRNKIEYYGKEYHKKVFLITSALAGEGKSTVAVNLAISLAQAGHKVALVDCDLRHPSDRKIFGIEDGPGLAEALVKKNRPLDYCLTAKELGMDEGDSILFLPGGKTLRDGSEYLGSERMKEIIGVMEANADYVILDSAPVGLLTDAVVLAQYADGAIFVVRKDFARVDYIMDGMEQLAESRVQIIGGVLNGV